MSTHAWGTHAADKPLQPMLIERRTPGPHDVQVEIAYCGICHSDLHTARNEWGGTHYPCVPGHEIVGTVSAVGTDVTGFAVGETVGIGCLAQCCGECRSCLDGLENYCENGLVGTYDSPSEDPPGHTLGGYSTRMVIDQRFVLKIRHPADQLAAVAPLLCAGITTYSPLRKWGAGPGKKVGIVGIGGLGHMGIKLAHAMGAHVVALTTTEEKRQAAIDLGADEAVLSPDREEMAAHADSFDLILDTVAASHKLDTYISLLRRDGTLVLLGVPEHPHPAPNYARLIFKRKVIAGSLIGGIPETQEMLDFCAAKDIYPDVEFIRMDEVNDAYERLLKNDVRYRFIIDMSHGL